MSRAGTGECRYQSLNSALNIELYFVAEGARERADFVRSAAKRTAEFRVVEIELHAGLADLAQRNSVELVCGCAFVARARTLPKVGIDGDFLRKLDAKAGAESLEEIAVEKTGA